LHDQVLFHHAQAGGQRSRVAVRTQGHVHTESKTVLRDLGQGGDQFLAHANEKLVIRQAALARLGSLRVTIFRVNKDQVDVRRDIQLAAALLAHRQDHQCLFLA